MADFYVMPQDFGAVGDGVTDDTAAIQAAIDAVCDSAGAHYRKTIMFKGGEYIISDTILLRPYVKIVGTYGNTLIRSNMTKPMFAASGGSVTRTSGVHLSGLQMTNTSKNNAGGVGILMRNACEWVVEDLYIAYLEKGIRVYGDNNSGGGEGAYYNRIRSINMGAVGTGIEQDSVVNQSNANDNKYADIHIGGATIGFDIIRGNANVFDNCGVEGATTGYRVGAHALSTAIVHPRFEALTTGIQVLSGAVNTRIYPLHNDGVTTVISNGAGSQTSVIGPNTVTTPEGPAPDPETIVWNTVFQETLTSSTYGNGWANSTLCACIAHSALNLSSLPSGKTYTYARVTFAPSSTEGLLASAAAIGNKASSGSAQHYASTPTLLKFNGSDGFQSTVDKVSDAAAFTYTGNNGVVVRIAVPSTATAHDEVRYKSGVTGVTRAYGGPNDVSSLTPSGYSTSSNLLECVTKIEFGYETE